MALVKVKPTSAGRRAVVKVVSPNLHKGAPVASLVEKQSKTAGRNNNGHITTRHKGGGHKQHYRLVDFRRNKDGIVAKVERLEYDPNRSAHLALLCYGDGERRYIIAPKGLVVGQTVVSGSEAPIKAGNALPIRNIPVGTTLNCVEMIPGKGAQLARSAGTYVQVVGRDRGLVIVRLNSGEQRYLRSDCMATVGAVSNPDNSNQNLAKAGRNRWLGKRPLTRGVAKNPVDHPHGGGEGRTSGGRHPVTPWGKPTKGAKTRSNKATDKMIIRSRHAKKKR